MARVQRAVAILGIGILAAGCSGNNRGTTASSTTSTAAATSTSAAKAPETSQAPAASGWAAVAYSPSTHQAHFSWDLNTTQQAMEQLAVNTCNSRNGVSDCVLLASAAQSVVFAVSKSNSSAIAGGVGATEDAAVKDALANIKAKGTDDGVVQQNARACAWDPEPAASPTP